MKSVLRGLSDIIGLVAGPFFAAYYFFDFSHGPAGPGPYYYYYRHNAQLGIAFGVALICLGFVMRNWAKETPSQSSTAPKQETRRRQQPSSRRSRRPRQDVKGSRPDRGRAAAQAKSPPKDVSNRPKRGSSPQASPARENRPKGKVEGQSS